jgi:phytanoyl-CoA hydroxylase
MAGQEDLRQTEPMTTTLADPIEAPARYEADGVVLLRGLLTPEEVASIGAAFLEQVEGDPDPECIDSLPEDDILRRYPRSVHPHRHPEREDGRIARRMMTDPRVISAVESLVGPVYAAQSMFYFKPPSARGQALHQDNLFLQSHPETCIAAWIAVDDCDAENGGLMVIPGSHKVPLLCADVEADPTESFTNVTIGVPEDAERVQTELKAGDVLFFHGSLVHGSGPNRSTDRFRRSLIFHYVPQASVEVARFYQPLVAPDGREVWIDESPEGGPCGTGWTTEGH